MAISKGLSYVRDVNYRRQDILHKKPLTENPTYYVYNYFKGVMYLYPHSPKFAMNVIFTLMPPSQPAKLNKRSVSNYLAIQTTSNMVRRKWGKMPYTFDQIIAYDDLNMYDSNAIADMNGEDAWHYYGGEAESAEMSDREMMHQFLEYKQIPFVEKRYSAKDLKF